MSVPEARCAPTQQDVYLARERIAGTARRTPLVLAEALSAELGANVHLKLESLQPTGSFKVRGAANKLLTLTPEERERGVVAVSTGNHGRAVAHVARRLGVHATVCISTGVPANKVAALRASGAEIVIFGASQDEAEVRAEELRAQHGLTLVHPFDDPLVIAGQGTIGLELLEELPTIDTVLVPLSGGGLVSGVALALKAANPVIRVVAVSAAAAPVMTRSLEAGRPLELAEQDTLADSLRGGIGLENRYTFRLVRELVDEHVVVSEEEIVAALRFLLLREQVVAEGAAAVGVAALLSARVKLGAATAVVVSGRNVDTSALLERLLAGSQPERS